MTKSFTADQVPSHRPGRFMTISGGRTPTRSAPMSKIIIDGNEIEVPPE